MLDWIIGFNSEYLVSKECIDLFAKIHHMERTTYYEADVNLQINNVSCHCYFLETDVYLFC